jgi:hypothetical protein
MSKSSKKKSSKRSKRAGAILSSKDLAPVAGGMLPTPRVDPTPPGVVLHGSAMAPKKIYKLPKPVHSNVLVGIGQKIGHGISSAAKGLGNFTGYRHPSQATMDKRAAAATTKSQIENLRSTGDMDHKKSILGSVKKSFQNITGQRTSSRALANKNERTARAGQYGPGVLMPTTQRADAREKDVANDRMAGPYSKGTVPLERAHTNAKAEQVLQERARRGGGAGTVNRAPADPTPSKGAVLHKAPPGGDRTSTYSGTINRSPSTISSPQESRFVSQNPVNTAQAAFPRAHSTVRPPRTTSTDAATPAARIPAPAAASSSAHVASSSSSTRSADTARPASTGSADTARPTAPAWSAFMREERRTPPPEGE